MNRLPRQIGDLCGHLQQLLTVPRKVLFPISFGKVLTMRPGTQKASMKSLAVSAALGAANGGLAFKVPNLDVPGVSSGTGNYEGLCPGGCHKNRKWNCVFYVIETSVKGAIGGQVANAGRTVIETAATAAATSACNANARGACK